MEKMKELKKGERAAKISTLVTLLLGIAKGLIGLVTNSTILLADSLHSFTDSISSFASFLGLRLSQKKPTERFPYGFYKSENLASLFISLLIFYASLQLMIEGFSKLYEESEVSFYPLALGIALVSSVVSLALSKYLKKVGSSINSQSLMASSSEKFIDFLSSLLVFVGLFLVFLKIPYVEGIFTIGISLLALKSGLVNAKDSLFSLLDVSPSKEIEERVIDIIKSIKGIEDFQNLKLRKAGPFIFGEVVIRVEKRLDVTKAHEIADKLEKSVKEKVKEIESFTVHIEPSEKKILKVGIPLEEDKGLESRISKRFGRARFFLLAMLNKEKGEIEGWYVKENPYVKEKVKAGLKAAKFLINEDVDSVITKEIGEIAFNTLKSNLVSIIKLEGLKAKDVIDNFFEGRLEVLEKPSKEEVEEIKREKEKVVIPRIRGYGRRWGWRKWFKSRYI